MRFGLCTGIGNFELAKRLGFDYIECMVTEIASLNDAEFEKIFSDTKRNSFFVERVNVLFPGTINLYGNENDRSEMEIYLEKAFIRVKKLGAEIVVFGSGKVRSVPDNLPFKEGYKRLVNTIKYIASKAGDHNLKIAIEPLNKGESNCINTLKEGAMLEADVDSPNIGLLADFYHMRKDDENIDNILSIKSLIHAHIAVVEGRGFPLKASGDIDAFFAALKKINYSGTVSLEAGSDNFENDAGMSLKFLKSIQI